ncbi:hypothetical protein Tco_1156490 [Tanacetum coccineum]
MRSSRFYGMAKSRPNGKLILQLHMNGPYSDKIPEPGITNQNPNGNGNVVAARAEGNATGNNGNQIRCYNCIGLGSTYKECTVRPNEKGMLLYLQTSVVDCSKRKKQETNSEAKRFDLMLLQ